MRRFNAESVGDEPEFPHPGLLNRIRRSAKLGVVSIRLRRDPAMLRPISLASILLLQFAFETQLRAADAPAAASYTTDTEILYRSEAEANTDYARSQCRLDFYRPVGVKNFPTVVFYHGGGLMGGKRSIPKELQNRGWGVVGVSYRLSPHVKHPTYIEDAAAALAWTFKNVERHGGDPNKIFVTGISAGGYLTAMLGLDKSYLAKHSIDANRIAALIPVTGQMITHFTVRTEQGIERDRPTIDRFAPLYHVRGDAPPMLCISGDWETDTVMRCEENLYFVSMMKQYGHKNVRHVVIEGADHGGCGRQCWPHVVKFVEERLAAKP
jgi:acetyl esterase/lipase